MRSPFPHRAVQSSREFRVMPPRLALEFLMALSIVPWLFSSSAHAQATRAFVSGTGNDINPCTVSSPCRTLQAALGKTAAGGEIYTRGSADYGVLTIDKAISIISETGVAGILVPSGTVGVTISAGAADFVTLRGFEIDGAGSGANGIVFSSGAGLNVKNSMVRGLAQFGINFQSNGSSTLLVENTLISNNANAGV